MTTNQFNEYSQFNETEMSALISQMEQYLYDEYGYNHNLEAIWIVAGNVWVEGNDDPAAGYQGLFSYDTKDNKQGKGWIDFTCHRPNGEVIENLDIHRCGGFNK
jgi:hypothetical protein